MKQQSRAEEEPQEKLLAPGHRKTPEFEKNALFLQAAERKARDRSTQDSYFPECRTHTLAAHGVMEGRETQHSR